jgi:site-specific DNA-methyltransferase (adenine-specific)
MRRGRPTGPTRKEAVNASFYQAVDKAKYPRLQILTVEDLLTGKLVQRPSSSVTFKRTPTASGKKATNLPLDFAADGERD